MWVFSVQVDPAKNASSGGGGGGGGATFVFRVCNSCWGWEDNSNIARLYLFIMTREQIVLPVIFRHFNYVVFNAVLNARED